MKFRWETIYHLFAPFFAHLLCMTDIFKFFLVVMELPVLLYTCLQVYCLVKRPFILNLANCLHCSLVRRQVEGIRKVLATITRRLTRCKRPDATLAPRDVAAACERLALRACDLLRCSKGPSRFVGHFR